VVRRVKVLPTPDAEITEAELECTLQNDRGDPQTQLFRLLCGLDAPLKMLVPVREYAGGCLSEGDRRGMTRPGARPLDGAKGPSVLWTPFLGAHGHGRREKGFFRA
jgi:hypothetical protein